MNQPKELKGRTVLVVALSAFAVILAANMAMLFAATGSFPGLVVKNSYVAGLGWDDRAAAQEALGWEATVGHDGETLLVRLEDADGGLVRGLRVTAVVGLPATDEADREVALEEAPDGYRVPIALGPGNWRIEIVAQGPAGDGAAASAYRATAALYLPRSEG